MKMDNIEDIKKIIDNQEKELYLLNEQLKKQANKKIKLPIFIISSIIILIIVFIILNITNNSSHVKVDVSEVLCNIIFDASKEANITTTKYYYKYPYCVWEVDNYIQEYIVKCNNENNTLNIMIHSYNVSTELLESKFIGCNIVKNK